MEDDPVDRPGRERQLTYAEPGRDGVERRHGGQDEGRLRQVKTEPLRNLGKRQISVAVVSHYVDQHALCLSSAGRRRPTPASADEQPITDPLLAQSAIDRLQSRGP